MYASPPLGSVWRKSPATRVQGCDAGGVQEKLRTLNHGSEVEQDATRVRIGPQDGGKQCPPPTAIMVLSPVKSYAAMIAATSRPDRSSSLC